MERKISAEKYLIHATKKMIKDYNKLAQPHLRISVYELDYCLTIMFPPTKTRTFIWTPLEKIDLKKASKIFMNIAQKVETWSAEQSAPEKQFEKGDRVKFIARNSDFGLVDYPTNHDKIGDEGTVESESMTTDNHLGYFVKLDSSLPFSLFYDARVLEKAGEADERQI